MRAEYFLTLKSQLDSLPNDFLTFESYINYSSYQGLLANSNWVSGHFQVYGLRRGDFASQNTLYMVRYNM